MPPSFFGVRLPAIIILSLISSCLSFNPAFPYGSQKVRGVNLGGWLVLEPWITPSLFDNTGNDAIIDEWTFGELQSYQDASSALEKHWNTFITERDFKEIAAAGLNHVRLPIGYWAFDVSGGEPYIQGQLPYLTKAVEWSAKHGLKVIFDLHGAPGSQNGFDNSGQKKSWPEWHSNQTNIDRTNVILKTMASVFSMYSDTVTVIAPLNEPAGFCGEDVLSATKQYWLDSYGNIRYPYGSAQQSDVVELIHDAFQPTSYWSGWQTGIDFQGVAMDTHIYQVFSVAENQRTFSEHVQSACATHSDLSSFDLWVIVGEWTPAMTDCAKYLNGRGVGSRYDGSYPDSTRVGSCKGLTGDAADFSASFKKSLRQMWEAQVITFEKAQGWIQWTWKTEMADEWSYQAGLANGWIPQDPTNYKYPDICN